MKNEEQPAKVPIGDRPEGEVPEHCYGAERKVWTDAMLITLHERRVRGTDRREIDYLEDSPVRGER